MRTKLPSSAARSTTLRTFRLGERFAEVEPQVRELDRHVHTEAFGFDALEDPEVLVDDTAVAASSITSSPRSVVFA